MDERRDTEAKLDGNPRSAPGDADKTEGVRIIGAEEAAEALERGDVAARRGEGQPRYGDRPEAPPAGARSALRFPLPNRSDPAEVVRPRVSGGTTGAPLPPWTDPPTGEVPLIVPQGQTAPFEGDDTGDDLQAWSAFATSGPRWRDQPGDWEEPDYDDASMLHDEGTRIGALDTSDRPGPEDLFDFGPAFDDDTGSGRAQSGPSSPNLWMSADAASAEDDFDASSSVSGADDRELDALDGDDADPADANLTFDDVEGEPAGQERRVVRTGRRTEATGGGGSVSAAGGGAASDREMTTAIAIGVALVVVCGLLLAVGPGAVMVLVTAVAVLAAAELFGALQRGGYQPATLLGLVAVAAVVTATYWRGEIAIPLVLGLTVVATLLWYLVGVTRLQPTMNTAVSLFGVFYIGLLTSFAALILLFPNGTGVFAGVILAVVANDVGALVVGRQFGRLRMAPDISPNKTWEGFAGGTIASIAVCTLVLGVIGWHPWSVGSAFWLGVVVSMAAPLGDLCESMVKRDIGVKDMGSVLPGHGGLLDRFDALLFALPATYYLCRLLEVF